MATYVDADMAASRAAREKMEQQGLPWLKVTPDPKGTFIRVLPPHKDMIDPDTGRPRFYEPVCLHFKVGPSQRTVPCPRRMSDPPKPCPICKYAFDLKDRGQDREGQDMLPSWQAYMNVIVLDADGEPVRKESGDLEVKVWSCGRGVLDQIFEALEEREQESGSYPNFTSPKEGLTLKLKRQGLTKNDTKYKVYLAKSASSIMGFEDDWAEQIRDLSKLSPMLSLGELTNILTGVEEDPFAGKALSQGRASQFADDDEESVDGEFTEVPAPEGGESAAERLKAMVAAGKGED